MSEQQDQPRGWDFSNEEAAQRHEERIQEARRNYTEPPSRGQIKTGEATPEELEEAARTPQRRMEEEIGPYQAAAVKREGQKMKWKGITKQREREKQQRQKETDEYLATRPDSMKGRRSEAGSTESTPISPDEVRAYLKSAVPNLSEQELQARTRDLSYDIRKTPEEVAFHIRQIMQRRKSGPDAPAR